ncbi:CerR family C-terminal domain-containing protein [Kiritimatiellaeota bacterium B1221]|nr:CerR family C-terminal domain-containing protein [Kiritimatiellaeota bacterium B1221]
MTSAHNTKERLVDAASEIFSMKGYRETTVAEICEAADANIAAVNYHFGDKLNLYREVWSYLFEEEARRQPLTEDYEEPGVETWLRVYLRSRIENILDNGFAGRLPRLLHREMGEHTELHEEIFITYLKPHHELVTAAIKQLLGSACTGDQLKLAVHNFMGVHIFLNVGRQKSQNPAMGKGPKNRLPEFEDPAELICQLEAFAIGGLLATRDLILSMESKA